MTTTQITRPPEPALVDRLAAAFNRTFETFEADEDVFQADVFCDLLPPMWRFQLEGREAFAAQLQAITPAGSTARIIRVVPTATGFVLEHEHTQLAGDSVEVARRLWLCEVRDGRIAEVLGYCNGGWDDDLRARHAAETTLLRP